MKKALLLVNTVILLGSTNNLMADTSPPSLSSPLPAPSQPTDSESTSSEQGNPTAVSTSTPPPSTEPATESPPPTLTPPAPEPAPHRFRKATISPQVGYTFFPKSTYDFDGLKLNVDKRNAFTAKLHFDLGGDGLSFELAPLFSMEKIGGDLSSISQDLGEGVAGKFFAIGGQTNLVYRASWGRIYPHVGLGFHGSWLVGDDIRYGAEIYGRIPLGITAYLAPRLALVVEVAYMFGATGIRGEDPDAATLDALQRDLQATHGIDATTIDWSTTSPSELQSEYNLTNEEVNTLVDDAIGDSIKFGKGSAFELMIGIRFP